MNRGSFVIWVLACLNLSAPARPASAQQRLLAEGVKELATEIAASATKVEKRKIAIVPFRELDGSASVLGTYLAEALTTNLFRIGSLEIVERSMLDKVLRELKLSESGAIDGETAKKVGKIVAVDAIVTGSLTGLASYVSVNCRMIDAESGRVFAAAETSVFKDDNLRKIMAAPLASNTVGGKTEPTPSGGMTDSRSNDSRRSAIPAPVIQTKIDNLLFELEACRWSAAIITCTLFVRNDLSERVLYISAGQTRAYGEGGAEYRSSSVRLGSTGWMTRLPTGVPVRAVVSFRDVPATATQFRTIELACRGAEPFTVALRNVPIVH